MATSGTTSGIDTNYGYKKVTLLGLNNTNPSPSFSLKGFPYGSFHAHQIGGTAATSIQLFGSNDGGVSWVAVSSAVNFASSLASGPTAGTLNAPFELYQFQVVGGDGTTSITVNCIAYPIGR